MPEGEDLLDVAIEHSGGYTEVVRGWLSMGGWRDEYDEPLEVDGIRAYAWRELPEAPEVKP